jgi:hypothetical protein
MDPIPVELTGSDTLDVSVPDLIRALGQGDAIGFPASERIEETQFDLRGMRGEQREVDALPVPARAERQW